MKTQIYATYLSNTSQFVCHKNHICVLIRKKLFWEHVLNGLVVQYLFVMVGREMELYHRSPLRVLNISLIKVVELLTICCLVIVKWSMVWIILMVCVTLMWPLFLKSMFVLWPVVEIGGNDDGRFCFSNSFHVNTCKGRTSDAQCRIGWWPALH